MKAKRILPFLGIIFYFLVSEVQAQNIYNATVSNVDFVVTSPVQLNACKTENISILVSANQARSGVGFDLSSLNAAIDIDMNGISVSDPLQTFTISGTVLTFDNALTAGQSLTITVPVKANCTTLTGTNQNHSLQFIGKAAGNNSSFVSVNFLVQSGFLEYIPSGSTNVGAVNGHVGDPIVRTIRFNNTSGTNPFYGAIHFTDHKAPAIQVNNISVAAFNNGGSPATGAVVTISPAPILPNGEVNAEISIENLPSGGYIILTENTEIISCPQLADGAGEVVMSWGCAGNTCKGFLGQSTALSISTSVGRAAGVPNLLWEIIDNPPGPDACIDPTQHRTYRARLINHGTAPARNIKIGVGPYGTGVNTSTFVMEGDFQIAQNTTAYTTASIATFFLAKFEDLPSKHDATNCFAPGDNYIDRVVLNIPLMKQDEYIVIEWTEKDCCPLNIPLTNNHSLGRWRLYGEQEIFDECNDASNYFQTLEASWNTNTSSIEKYINPALQSVISTVTHMKGCSSGDDNNCSVPTTCLDSEINSIGAPNCDFTENFAVDNNNFYLRLQSDGYPIDLNQMTIEVDIVTEARISLSPRTHFADGTEWGNIRFITNGSVLTPFQVDQLPSTDPIAVNSGYIHPHAYRAKFRIPQSIWDPLLYNIGMQEIRISQFINASEIHFEISATCDEQDIPGGQYRYTEKMYLNADPTCVSGCRIPIGESGGKVNVLCPGCEWPGVKTNVFDFKRTSIGQRDDDNNGIPDNSGTDAIRTNYMTFKDIVHAKSVSTFWGNSGLYDYLQEDPEFGPNFLNNLCRIDEIPYGDKFDIYSTELHVEIQRGATTWVADIPFSAVPAMATRLGDKFLYQITPQMIRDYQSSSLPVFDNYAIDDKFVIELDYIIARDFDFGDPNKYSDAAEIKNDIFLTGSQKDLSCTSGSCFIGLEVSDVKYTDAVISNPVPPDRFNTLIHKDLRYVCEKWGTSARFIRNKFSFGLVIFDNLTNHFLQSSADPSDKCSKHIFVNTEALPGNVYNVFPNEVRNNTGRLKTLKVNIPKGYVLDPARSKMVSYYSFKLANDFDFNLGGESQDLQEYNSSSPATFYNYRYIGPSSFGDGDEYEFYFNYSSSHQPVSYYAQNEVALADGVFFTPADEATQGRAFLVIVPSCDADSKPADETLFGKPGASNPVPSWVAPGYNLVELPTSYFGDLPDGSIVPVRDVLYYANESYGYITVPNGDLIINPFVGDLFVNQPNQQFEFTLTNNNSNPARNVYIAPELSNPAFTITNVEVEGIWVYQSYNWVYQPGWVSLDVFDQTITSTLSTAIYKGTLGNNNIVNIPPNQQLKIRIIGNYDCNINNTGTDLKFNYGWNCDENEPDDFDDIADACNLKFSSFTVKPANPALASDLTPLTNINCDQYSMRHEIISLNEGLVFDLNATITLPNNQISFINPLNVTFTRVNLSGTPTYSTVSGVTPTVSGLDYTWDLSAITALDLASGIGNGDKIVMEFDLTGTCQYAYQAISSSVNGINFCNGIETASDQQATIPNTNQCNRPQISVSGNTTLCPGQSLSLLATGSAGTPGYSFVWTNTLNQVVSNTADLNVASLSSSTQYTVLITDANGCTNIQIVSVTVQTLTGGSIIGLSDDYCQSNTAVNISGLPAGGTFSGTGISGNTFTPSTPGTYQITYTYTMGACTGVAIKTVTVYPTPSVSLTLDPPPHPAIPQGYCLSEMPVTLSGTPAGGTFGGAAVTGNIFNPTVPGDYGITYTYTDGNGCTGGEQEIVRIYDNMEVSILGNHTACFNEDVTLVPQHSGGFPPYSFRWYANGTLVATGGIYVHNSIVAGDITYTVEIISDGCSAMSDPFIITTAECCTYKIGDVTKICGDNNRRFCVPLQAVHPVPNGIIGMDYCLKYDPALMTPVAVNNATNKAAYTLGPVVSHTSSSVPGMGEADIFVNTTIPGQVRISIFYRTSTPVGTYFSGTGDVICVPFDLNAGVTSGANYLFEACELQEAYTLMEAPGCWEAGTLTVTTDNILRGQLIYWGNPARTLGTNYTVTPTAITTNIRTVNNDCSEKSPASPTVIPSGLPGLTQNGTFNYNYVLGDKIKFTRDIQSSTTINSAYINGSYVSTVFFKQVNGFDTYRMARITTYSTWAAPGFTTCVNMNYDVKGNSGSALYCNPSIYEMIAADVNINGKIRANDISLLQQRITKHIPEYPQVWNNGTATPSLDWRYIDQTTTTTAPFQISATYPDDDFVGYSRDRVPSFDQCLNILPSCMNERQIFSGVLLGDLGAYTSGTRYLNTNPNVKTTGKPKLTFEVVRATDLQENQYRVLVKYEAPEDTLVSIDFAMDYNQNNIGVINLDQTFDAYSNDISMIWNDYEHSELILTSYTLTPLPDAATLYYFDIMKSSGVPVVSDFGPRIALFNGEEVETEVVITNKVTDINDVTTSSAPYLIVTPNPALDNSSEIMYQIYAGDQNSRIVVYNALGQVVLEYSQMADRGQIPLNIDTLSAGSYVCILYTNDTKITEKFVIEK